MCPLSGDLEYSEWAHNESIRLGEVHSRDQALDSHRDRTSVSGGATPVAQVSETGGSVSRGTGRSQGCAEGWGTP